MPKIFGYARVSTKEQDLSSQIDSLVIHGCRKSDIYSDVISGVRSKRPGLDKCLSLLTKGDTLLVLRLDRLGRSMTHLVSLIEDLGKKGIFFKSVSDGAIDTTTASGELVFNIFSSLAQFERKLIQERTKAGLSAARARGKLGGRKKIQASDPRVVMAKNMHKDHTMPIDDICKTLKISRPSFYRFLKL